jgi:LmbE family N-acetylglucosaminyl deacetylase
MTGFDPPRGASGGSPGAGTWLYLSPHLDDVVLSCGGQIARATRAGTPVEILTICAGDEPARGAPVASPLVREIYTLWKLAPGEAMATRRREDADAGRALGARIRHWDLQEAIHRLDPESDRALYPSYAALFGPIASGDETRIAELARRFAELPGAATAARLVSPLGIGGHADHRLVRAAAERAFGARLRYYEEFPYIVWKRFARLRAGIFGRSWEAMPEPLSGEDIAARISAIGCYESQLPSLFRTPENLERQVRRHVRRAGGERLWRRTGRERRPSR